MKHTIYTLALIFVIICSFLPIKSQNPTTLVNRAWIDTTGHPNVSLGLELAISDTSGLYTIGNTYNAGDSEYVLFTKYDNTGNIVWQNNNSFYPKRAFATDLTLYNNILYAAVTVWDSVNHKAKMVVTGLNATTGTGLFDPSYISPLSPDYAIATSIRVSADGIYIAGTEAVNDTEYEFTLVKYDTLADVIFVAHYDSATLNSGAVSLSAVNGSGPVTVTGYSGRSYGGYDIVTTQFDRTTGNLYSVSRVPNGSGGFTSHPVAVSKDIYGNNYVVGAAEESGPNVDIKIIKYDTLFNPVYVINWGGPDSLDDEPSYMVQDNAGNMYISGYTTHANGEVDLLVLKYRQSDGTLLWSKTVNNSNSSTTHIAKGNSLVTDASNNVYVTGQIYNGTNYDAITNAYDLNGNQLWQKTATGGIGTDNIGMNVALDADNNVYTSGTAVSATSTQYITMLYAQLRTTNTVVYDTGRNPLYLQNQLIVKFAPNLVNGSFVDNQDQQFIALNDLIPDSIVDLMNSQITPTTGKPPFDFGLAKAVKIFKHFHTYDTLSISRLGDTVNMRSFWSTFLLILPNPTDTMIMVYSDSLDSLFPNIRYAEPNYTYRYSDLPNDPMFTDQNSLYPTNTAYTDAHINIDPAWDIQKGNAAIKVGIYDSGIEWDHIDFSFDGSQTLQNSTVAGGWDWYDDVAITTTPYDDDGHGTNVAGIVGALRNNSTGVAGIAGGDITNGIHGSQLFDMKISVSGSLATAAQIANAITEGSYYHPGGNPVGYGLHIMNCSWGTSSSSSVVQDAVNKAWLNQVLIVASRGNQEGSSGSNPSTGDLTGPNYPATSPSAWLISVGGSGSNGAIKDETNGNMSGTDLADQYGFSMYGDGMDLIAPATDVLVKTLDNSNGSNGNSTTSYTTFNGTSSAAPHVAGVAALMMAEQNVYGQYSTNNLAPEDVKFLIDIYAKNGGTYNSVTGYGLLDAGNVMQHLDYPMYQVYHSNTSPASRTVTQTASNDYIDLSEDWGAVAAGTYEADLWQVTENYTNTFSSTTTVLNAWPRLASTVGVGTATGVVPTFPSQTFTSSLSGNTATVTGITYAWHITYDIQGNALDYWVPDVTDNIHAAYSLQIYDPDLTAINDTLNKVSRFVIYPNPSSGLVQMAYSVNQPQSAILKITDLSGNTVKTLNLGNRNNGPYNEKVDVTELEAGMYFFNLCIGKEVFTKKLVKTD